MSIHDGHGFSDGVLTLFESKTAAGIEATTQTIVEQIRERKVRPSFKDLQDGLILTMRVNPNLTEAIASDVFNTINREVIIDAVMQGYESVPRIGRELVTVIDIKGKKEARIARAIKKSRAEETKELEEYKKGELSDEYATGALKKYGEQIILSIEAIEEDQTGTVVQEARDVGMGLAEDEEEIILNTIQDATGYEAYRPAGTQTALYVAGAAESTTQAPAKNLKTSNALADWTDIDNALQLLGSKLGKSGKPIGVPSNISLLVPWALRGTAAYITRNTKDTRATINADAPQLLALPDGARASAWLDTQSTTTWYLGDFARQFLYLRRWALRTIAIAGSRQASLLVRDIDRIYLAQIYFGIMAKDFRTVIKNTT